MKKKNSSHFSKRHFQTSILPKLTPEQAAAANDQSQSSANSQDNSELVTAQSIYRMSSLVYSADYQPFQIKTARTVRQELLAKDWSEQAIAGVLGNMAVVSQLQVNLQDQGYGLLQWTKLAELAGWCQHQHLDYQTVVGQCAFLNYELQISQHFQADTIYEMTGAQYLQSTAQPEVLAEVFAKSYRGVAQTLQLQRGTQAQYWYHYLQQSPKETATIPRNYTVNQVTPIRLQPDEQGMVVGEYAAGETINYVETEQIANQTWLVYYNPRGQKCYVLVPSKAAANQTPVQREPSIHAYTLLKKTIVYDQPDITAKKIGTLAAGKVIHYEKQLTNSAGDWLAYRSASQDLRYLLIASKRTINTSGEYHILKAIPVYDQPNAQADTIGQLPEHTLIKYQRKFYQNDHWWLEYRSASGNLCYLLLPEPTADTNVLKTYAVQTLSSIHLTPSLQSKILGHYNPGETVHYFKTVDAEGYTWLVINAADGSWNYVPKLN